MWPYSAVRRLNLALDRQGNIGRGRRNTDSGVSHGSIQSVFGTPLTAVWPNEYSLSFVCPSRAQPHRQQQGMFSTLELFCSRQPSEQKKEWARAQASACVHITHHTQLHAGCVMSEVTLVLRAENEVTAHSVTWKHKKPLVNVWAAPQHLV